VSYGTEAGLFAAALGVPAVVCGPGDMAQGHLPDEFIDRDELVRCDLMLDRLIGALSA
jgi:acetylornithine deacetylase